MMAAFGEVLAAWSGETRFALNIPGMNRLPLHPEVEKVIGEFASVSVLEIDHDPVQRQRHRAGRTNTRHPLGRPSTAITAVCGSCAN